MLTQFDKDNLEGILCGEGSHFTAQLLLLIAKADMGNRGKLAIVFPQEVQAVNEFQGVKL